jgi:hypothetical protein
MCSEEMRKTTEKAMQSAVLLTEIRIGTWRIRYKGATHLHATFRTKMKETSVLSYFTAKLRMFIDLLYNKSFYSWDDIVQWYLTLGGYTHWPALMWWAVARSRASRPPCLPPSPPRLEDSAVKHLLCLSRPKLSLIYQRASCSNRFHSSFFNVVPTMAVSLVYALAALLSTCELRDSRWNIFSTCDLWDFT